MAAPRRPMNPRNMAGLRREAQRRQGAKKTVRREVGVFHRKREYVDGKAGKKTGTKKPARKKSIKRKQIIVRRIRPKQQQPSIGSQLNVGRDISGSQVIQTLHGNAVFHHGIATVARPLPRRGELKKKLQRK